MFVDDEKVPVTDGEHTIYIRDKMNVKISNKVAAAGVHVTPGSTSKRIEMGENLDALMIYNILDWEGPKFYDKDGNKIPCTPENILRLDVNEPVVQKAQAEITRRNQKRVTPDPKLVTPGLDGLNSSGLIGTSDQSNGNETETTSLSYRLATMT